LGLLVEGRDNREITDRFHLSLRTVSRTLSSAYRELGVRSRSEAAITALNKGIVRSDPHK
jgi:DNA-binding NarL/FixJ family response regulator